MSLHSKGVAGLADSGSFPTNPQPPCRLSLPQLLLLSLLMLLFMMMMMTLPMATFLRPLFVTTIQHESHSRCNVTGRNEYLAQDMLFHQIQQHLLVRSFFQPVAGAAAPRDDDGNVHFLFTVCRLRSMLSNTADPSSSDKNRSPDNRCAQSDRSRRTTQVLPRILRTKDPSPSFVMPFGTTSVAKSCGVSVSTTVWRYRDVYPNWIASAVDRKENTLPSTSHCSIGTGHREFLQVVMVAVVTRQPSSSSPSFMW